MNGPAQCKVARQITLYSDAEIMIGYGRKLKILLSSRLSLAYLVPLVSLAFFYIVFLFFLAYPLYSTGIAV